MQKTVKKNPVESSNPKQFIFHFRKRLSVIGTSCITAFLAGIISPFLNCSIANLKHTNFTLQ